MIGSNQFLVESPSHDGAATKVLVVGQTPPPHCGQAIMIECLVKSDLADVQLIHVRMCFSSHMNEVGRFRISKVFHLFSLIVRIIYHRFADGVRILYYPPAGRNRVPVYRDIIILICTRWLFDKTIFHFHASGVSDLYDRLPFWQRWLFRRAYLGADAAIRISDLTPEDGKLLQAKREFVVSNGIENPFSEESVIRSESRSGSQEPMRILSVGVICEGKGVMVLIEACGELAARGVPIHLDVMGPFERDEFAARLRSRISELRIDDRVQFLGVLTGDEKFAVYARSDVLCHPSHYDTFPVVLLEAMAAGLPVVSTFHSGIPSIVDDGVTGILVKPRDATAVADKLACLAQNVELRMQMGAAGRKKFLREYTLARHIDRMRQVFLDVAGQSCVEKSVHVAKAPALHG